MNAIIDWLLQPTTNGATRLQAILLCVVLVGVVLYGIKMVEEIIEDCKEIRGEENIHDKGM